jgi:hypothetical protein
VLPALRVIVAPISREIVLARGDRGRARDAPRIDGLTA